MVIQTIPEGQGGTEWDAVLGAFIALGLLTGDKANGESGIVATTGQVINRADYREAVLSAVEAAKVRMDNISISLRDGIIDLAQWQLLIMAEIKIIIGLSAAIASGGTNQLNAEDLQFSALLVQEQFQFLQGFANEIAAGQVDLQSGRFLQRIALYGSAGIGAFEQSRRRLREGVAVQERRVLGIADHCNTQGGLEGCVELASKGFQPVDTLPDIGVSPCRKNCKCHFEYMDAFGNIFF